MDQRPPQLGLFAVHVEATQPPNRCCPDELPAASGERIGLPALGVPVPRILVANRLPEIRLRFLSPDNAVALVLIFGLALLVGYGFVGGLCLLLRVII